MFQLDWRLVYPVRVRRPAETLPNSFRELLALRCGLRVTNYMVDESLSSWPAVRWLQAATSCIFVAASCYCLGIEVFAITMWVFAISLGVSAIMLGVFTSRTQLIIICGWACCAVRWTLIHNIFRLKWKQFEEFPPPYIHIIIAAFGF